MRSPAFFYLDKGVLHFGIYSSSTLGLGTRKPVFFLLGQRGTTFWNLQIINFGPWYEKTCFLSIRTKGYFFGIYRSSTLGLGTRKPVFFLLGHRGTTFWNLPIRSKGYYILESTDHQLWALVRENLFSFY